MSHTSFLQRAMTAALATLLALTTPASAAAAPGRPTAELVALVAAVDGDVSLRPAAERQGSQPPAGLRPLSGLREGDRIEGSGVVLAVCPDGAQVRFEAPWPIERRLCTQPTRDATVGSASPDPGRWLIVDGAVVVQSGARDGALKDEDLGRRPILLSPGCPRQTEGVAACANWWQAPAEITWLGVADADTYVLSWSQMDSAPLRAAAATSCGLKLIDTLAADLPQCRTPWPRSWQLAVDPGELTLQAVRGRFGLLPGHDISVLQLRSDEDGAEPTQAGRSEGLARALTYYRAGRVQPALAELLRLPAARCADWVPELRRIRSDLWRGSGLTPLADRDLQCLSGNEAASPTHPQGDSP